MAHIRSLFGMLIKKFITVRSYKNTYTLVCCITVESFLFVGEGGGNG